jgi:hypothetical protein
MTADGDKNNEIEKQMTNRLSLTLDLKLGKHLLVVLTITERDSYIALIFWNAVDLILEKWAD